MLVEFEHEKCKFTTAEDRNKLGTKTRPRESGRNAPTREQMRLFASNIKKLQQEGIRAPLCGWDSVEALLP